MPASDVGKFDELMAAFNRGSLDVPADFLTPHTTYSLNGRSYESLLGGSPDDPLIRMLARGPAGYRTAAKALQYALQLPTIIVESVEDQPAAGVRVVDLRIDGRLRDTQLPFSARCSLRIASTEGRVTSMDLTAATEALDDIARARRQG